MHQKNKPSGRREKGEKREIRNVRIFGGSEEKKAKSE